MRVTQRVVLPAATVIVLGGLAGCSQSAKPPPRAASPALTSIAPDRTLSPAPSGAASSRPQRTAPNSAEAHPARRRPQAGSTAGPSLPPGSYDDTTGTTARKPKSQTQVLATLPGTSGSGCVSVGDRSNVRSGLVAMGNFADARAQFHKTKGAYDAAPSFFYVIPQDRHSRRVVVTLTSLTGRGEGLRVVSRQVEEAAQWRYFPISVKIPAPGTWRFTVTAGAQHGCFEATFQA